MQNISDISRRLSIVYVWSLLVFSFMESSILFFIFLAFVWSLNCTSLVCKFYNSFRAILSFWAVLISILWLFNSGITWKVNFKSCSFFRCFFLTCKLYMSGLYTIPEFGHGQCSIWGFLVLTFIKSASLTTIYFF